MSKKTEKPVLVLDTHRGIYFGYLVAITNDGRTVKLEKGRHCFYYPTAEAGHRGVYGLATVGPAEGAKIGPEVTMTINDVAKIVDCTPKAVQRWKKISW
jgi:hypothetical protein